MNAGEKELRLSPEQLSAIEAEETGRQRTA